MTEESQSGIVYALLAGTLAGNDKPFNPLKSCRRLQREGDPIDFLGKRFERLERFFR